MSYPFYPNPTAHRSDGTAELSAFSRQRLRDAAGYLPDKGLVDAVNVALLLGQPLLLTGEAGTGKTELAYHLAHVLKLGEPLKFETKSTSTARDLLYTYDAVGHFRAGQTGGSKDALGYLRWNALGEAILHSRETVEDKWLAPGFKHAGAKRKVVLVDEIDKAPRDFPNDLLNEVEHLYFRVPELDNDLIEADPANRPILVLTSNSEKHLPDAFLRRCIYYHIPFPEKRLTEIVLKRVSGYSDGQSPLLGEALKLFLHLRKQLTEKKPATAELLGWLTALHQMGADETQPLRAQAELLKQSLSTLVKGENDQATAHAIVEREDWLTAGSE
jgi:MoxR-like ATPase